MISQKAEAGRGRHLAPAPEIVSADTPEYSPALITKQASSAELFELVRALGSTRAFRRSDFLPGGWIPFGIPANAIVERLRFCLTDRTVQRYDDEVLI
jgi:hypothetical protein